MVHPTIKILLVEDNPGDVLLLQESLAEIPLVTFELTPVSYLRDAIHCLQVQSFDVILLDLVLPDSQGLATFTDLHHQAPTMPVVVLTGITDETLAIRALQAGVQDYLIKGQVRSSELLFRSIRYAIERKRVESTLYQREQEFRTLAENAPDIIARVDPSLKHLYVNGAVTKATGLSVQEVLGRTNRELGMPEPQVSEWEAALSQVFRTGEPMALSIELSTPIGLRYYQSRCVPEFGLDGAVESVLGITRDLTEQKQLESQFLRAQRLESLGTLASGIAHDMNNILAPMLASAQLLPILVPNLDEQSQQLLKIFEDNTRRGTELVKQILTFARGLEGERTPIQVKHVLMELEQIIRSTFPKSIEIVRTFPALDLWLVLANATQLHQVFMNLCVNARDAMPHGGVLSIAAENRLLDETDARRYLDAKAGPYLDITFRDTGLGIAPEHLDRIFEPFYTTKPLGQGTGLGLSTAIGIIHDHGGFLTVSSQVGIGTEFQVLLPVVHQAELLPEAISKLPLGQGEMILIVDDEVSILKTLKITLETQNYRVLTAKDGPEAIAVYLQHQDDIKVILLDVMMPTMGGAKTIQILEQLNPKAKVIACSGIALRESLPPNTVVSAFLAKPFTADDLLQTLNTVLKNTPSIR